MLISILYYPYLSEKLNPPFLFTIFECIIAVGGADFRHISFGSNVVSRVSIFSEFILIPSLDPQSEEIFLPDVFNPTAEEFAELALWFVKFVNTDLLLISGCSRLISTVLDIFLWMECMTSSLTELYPFDSVPPESE